ncbi:MAG TPA: hypothetical protein QF762_04115 [Acidimicrobiales bacterium]|nr:hypothetical protein [Acidimicrobiales bacterium]
MKIVKVFMSLLLVAVLLSCGSSSAEDTVRELYYELAAEDGMTNKEFLDCALDLMKDAAGLSWEEMLAVMDDEGPDIAEDDTKFLIGMFQCMEMLSEDELETLMTE